MATFGNGLHIPMNNPELEEQKLQAGWLGKIFGRDADGKQNIFALLAFISLIATIIFFALNKNEEAKYIFSAFTLCIGLMIGKTAIK